MFKQDWHTQTKFDPGRKRFLVEHFEPVAAIRDRCLMCKTANEIVTVLRKNIKVVWLLREEDKRLNSLGYRSVRPDPTRAYRKARIRIISKPLRSRNRRSA